MAANMDAFKPDAETGFMCVGTCQCFTASMGFIGGIWAAVLSSSYYNKPAGECDQPLADWLLTVSVLWFCVALGLGFCTCLAGMGFLGVSNSGNQQDADGFMKIMVPTLGCISFCGTVIYQFSVLVGVMWVLNASEDPDICNQSMLSDVRRFVIFQVLLAVFNCCGFGLSACAFAAYGVQEQRTGNVRQMDPNRRPEPGERRLASQIPGASSSAANNGDASATAPAPAGGDAAAPAAEPAAAQI